MSGDFQYDTFFLHPTPSSRFHFHILPHDHIVTLYSSPIISHCFGSYCLLPLFSSLVLPCSSFHCTFTTSFSRAVMDSIYTHHLQWLSFEFFSLDPHLQVRSMSLLYVHSADYRLWIPTCSCVECSPHAFRCCPYSRKTPPLVAEYLFSNHFVPSSQRRERLF